MCSDKKVTVSAQEWSREQFRELIAELSAGVAEEEWRLLSKQVV
ncbi:hypothetical protein [Halocatena halophila]